MTRAGASRAQSADLPAVAAPDASILADVDCGLCGSKRRKLRFEAHPYRVVECEECGLVYVTPRRDAERLGALYLEEYWRSPAAKDFGYTDYVKDERLYLKTFRKRIQVLSRFGVKEGRILDVGCAAGYFLAIAKEKGFACMGVELSETMAKFARERYGLDVRVGTLEAARFPDASFDCITFWDVLEHVPDPTAVLREARRLLAPGGIVLVETQNVDSAFARRMGSAWHHYKHAEHIYHFSPDTLRRVFERAGLECIHWQSDLGGKYVSLDFVVERAGRLHPILTYLLSPLKLVGRLAVYVNLQDEMIAIARSH